MGCGTSKESTTEYKSVKNRRATGYTPVVGVGRPVDAAEKRAAQLAAAEVRAAKEASRGLGSAAKAKELTDTSKKQELIGKINEAYAAIQSDPPLGLNLASVEQLKHHLEQVQSRNK